MATSTVTIESTSDVGSLDKLHAAIQARSEAIKKTIADSTVAAAITILRSLKAGTKAAPTKKVPSGSYTITKTSLVGGVRRVGGGFRVVARNGHRGAVSSIRPAIGYAPGSVRPSSCFVYRITPANTAMKFAKNVNAPEKCWYVLCEHEGQAKAYAEARIIRMLQNESGMARAALAIAQAKASTYNKNGIVSAEQWKKSGTMSDRAASLSYSAANLTVSNAGFDSGACGVEFFDALNYSDPAAGGQSALAVAIDKAANSLLGAYAKDEIADIKQPDSVVNASIKSAFANRT